MPNTPPTIDGEDVPQRPQQQPQPVAAMSTRFKQHLIGWGNRHGSKIFLCGLMGTAVTIVLAPVTLSTITGLPNNTILQNLTTGMGGLMGTFLGLIGAYKIAAHIDDRADAAMQTDQKQDKNHEIRVATTKVLAAGGSVVVGLLVGYAVTHVLPSIQIKYMPRTAQQSEYTR